MAKKQEWWLARDGKNNGGRIILSRYPLSDCGDGGVAARDWVARITGICMVIEQEEYALLTDGSYPLRIGAKPRKVLLTLGVKEVKP